MKYLKHINFFILILLFSCKNEDDSTGNGIGDPIDLSISVEIATDGSGEVTVTAVATNVFEYRFYMGDGGVNEPYANFDGVYQHTYETLGTYEIEVRAYGTSGRFIKKTKQITVISGEPVSVGQGYSSPTSYPGMTMVWNDEFEGNLLNESNWSYDLGDGCPNLCGWGNGELEYYRAENVSVGGGTLTLEARDEDFGGRNFTSGKIISRGKQSFKYGRIDVRALLPKGQGMWPALWLLGINQASVGWPQCGEIDLMEMIGGNNREGTSSGNVYWYENGTANFQKSYTLASGTFADEYHVFSIIWTETEIKWLVNDVEFHSFSTIPESRNAFQKEFFLIMNVAVGGFWPGSPDATTVFPQQMNVDYIRVFQ